MPHTPRRQHPCADCGQPVSVDATRCKTCDTEHRRLSKKLFRPKARAPVPETHPSVVVVPGLAGMAEAGCRHMWRLGEGYSAEGTCKLCGEVRRFAPHWRWKDAHGATHLEPEWTQEVFGRIPAGPRPIYPYELRAERM